MSHFSTIRTKIKDKPALIEALELLGERVNNPEDLGMSVVDLVITNPSHAEEHPTMEVDISIGVDVGFKFNRITGSYELIADRQTWDKDIPIERFTEKVTQQYARLMLHNVLKDEEFVVDEEWELDDNSIELTVSRWV
tara:strand:+ start:267 stop:680 length:414 start_codon:yes stop_codon:yes gene_type:complete